MRELNYLDYVAPRFAKWEPDQLKVIYISGKFYQFKGLDGRYNPHPFSFCPVADFMDPNYVHALLQEIKSLEETRKALMEKYQSFADYQQAHENEANLNTIELLLVMHEPETLFRRMDSDHSCQKLSNKPQRWASMW